MATPAQEVPIPAVARPRPLTHAPIPASNTPAPDSDSGLAVRDKPKTIGQGNDEIELRKLSPEERARRRFRYNLMVWTFCFVILFVVFLVLVWPAIRDS